MDPRTGEGMARRFYFNQVVAGDDVWLERAQWDALRGPARSSRERPLWSVLTGRTPTTGPQSAAKRLDGFQFTPRFADGKPMIWDPAQHGGYTPRGEVNAAVAYLFATYKVERLYADPPMWQSEIDQWSSQFGDKAVFRWATYRSRQMAECLERFRTDVFAWPPGA
jgi:hypothetical protein